MSYSRMFLVSLMFVGACVFPASAEAATVSDLMAQLAKIQAQLAQMRGQVLGVQTESALVLPAEPVVVPVTTTSTAATTTTTKTTTTSPLILPGYVGPTAATTTAAAPLSIEILDAEAVEEDDAQRGVYTVELEIYADDADIYIPHTVGQSAGYGFQNVVFSTPKWKGLRTDVVDSEAEQHGSYFVVPEGEIEYFRVETYLNPDQTGEYGTRLNSIRYATSPTGPLRTYALTSREKKEATTDELYLLGDLSHAAINVEPVSTSAYATETDAVYGTFKINFDVSANDTDIYVPQAAWNAVDFTFPNSGKIEKDPSSVLTSTADTSGNDFIVREGDTERFALTVVIQPAASGKFMMRMNDLGYRKSQSGEYSPYEIPKNLLADYTTDSITLTLGTTTSVKGAFDTKTLTQKNANPTIKGTASGTKTVGFSIGNGDKVYGSGDIKVNKNGKWSHQVMEHLRTGTYRITLYSNNVPIANGTLKVTDPSEEQARTSAIIVGVYEGSYPGGRQFRDTREGTVTVNVEADESEYAQPLVLTAYENTNWIIKTPNRAKITKIITVGYKNQRVTGAPAGVPIEHYSYEKNKTYYNAYKWKGTGYDALTEWVGQKTGGYSGVFYGEYTGSSFDVAYGWKA